MAPQPRTLAAALAGSLTVLPLDRRRRYWCSQPPPPADCSSIPLTEEVVSAVLAPSTDPACATETYARAYLLKTLTSELGVLLTPGASNAISRQCSWAEPRTQPDLVAALELPWASDKNTHQDFASLRTLLSEAGLAAIAKYTVVEEACESVEEELFYDADVFAIPLSKSPLEEEELIAIEAGGGGLATLIADAAARDRQMAERLVEHDGMAALRTLLDEAGDNMRMQSEIARALANLLVDPAARRIAKQSAWQSLLQEWAADSKADRCHLQAQAKRALVNLNSANASFLEDGHFLLGEIPDHNSSSADMDIVFIHGLRGDPVLTWRTEMHIDEETVIVWPRDWLQSDFPSARIFSFGYSVSLSNWTRSARNLPLEDQAAECLESLVAAGVGSSGPVCFVTHSFGGLLAKKLLLLGSKADEGSRERDLVESCRATVFFGTPHRGSPCAKIISSKVVGPALRASTPVEQLLPGSESLAALDKDFQRFALDRRVEVVSVAEGQPTNIAKLRNREFAVWLVPSQTADAGIGRFVTLQRANHPELCKPPTRTDARYTLVVDVLRRIMGSSLQTQ